MIERTDAEAEAPVLWPPDAKSLFIEKDPDAGKDRARRRKGGLRMRWLNDIIDTTEMSLRNIRLQRVRHNLVAEQQQKLNTKKRLPDETLYPC